MDWEEWYRIGYALYDGLGDAGRDLWEAWSAKSPKNDSKTTSEYWPRFAGGVGKEGAGVTIGTLLWHAKENGWKGGAGWITLNDLHAYLPLHSYIYTPTGALWPAVTVNSQLPSMPLFAKDGTRAHGPATKDKAGDLQPGKPRNHFDLIDHKTEGRRGIERTLMVHLAGLPAVWRPKELSDQEPRLRPALIP